MKLYISFDIEGVTGITDRSDINENSPGYIKARELSTGDVNAAIEGALAAGVSEIIVNDGHGWGRRTLLLEKLHPRARLLRGRVSTAWLFMAGFDRSYDAMFFIGWHARPGSPGILSHCLNSKAFTAWRVNGTPVGEAEIAAALAGEYDIPLVLFTGDDCACNEVRAWNNGCECVATKFAIDRYSAYCPSPEETATWIKEGAQRAIQRRNEIEPFRFQTPVHVEVDTVNDHIAQALALVPGVERIADLTVAFGGSNYEEIFDIFHALTLISVAVTRND